MTTSRVASRGALPRSTPDGSVAMIYVHIPFCRSRCTFCDWVQAIPSRDLTRGPEDSLRQKYVEALCAEIRYRGPQHADQRIATMYWGGGTASNLTVEETRTITEALEESFDLGGLVEATMECSPDTVDEEKLHFYREAGFDRISSGVQSFSDERLRRLGRRHSADQAIEIVHAARRAGFEKVSIDLMSGFPDQDSEELLGTIETALSLPLNHLSLYSYRPTERTFLRRQVDPARKRAHIRQQQILFTQARNHVVQQLPEYANGYFGEPSAFTALYFQCFADTIGLGSGAQSFSRGRYQSHAPGRLHDYVVNPCGFELDVPMDNDRLLVNLVQAGLSFNEGIPREQWRVTTGTELDEVLEREAVAPLTGLLRARGLVEDQRGIRLDPHVRNLTLIELAFEIAVYSAAS